MAVFEDEIVLPGPGPAAEGGGSSAHGLRASAATWVQGTAIGDFSREPTGTFEWGGRESDYGTNSGRSEYLNAGVSKLRSGLPPPVYRDFTNELVKAGLAAHLFDHLDPIAASFAFAGIDGARLGFYRQYGIDSRYYARAKERRIAIVALESATEHLRAVRPVSSRDSEEVVKGFLRDRADMKAHLEELVKAWERGDESALVRLILNGGPDSGLLKRVISDRTSRWLPQIDKLLLEPRNVFVVVGVGHLVGNGGLLELLKRRGLEVTQL